MMPVAPLPHFPAPFHLLFCRTCFSFCWIAGRRSQISCGVSTDSIAPRRPAGAPRQNQPSCASGGGRIGRVSEARCWYNDVTFSDRQGPLAIRLSDGSPFGSFRERDGLMEVRSSRDCRSRRRFDEGAELCGADALASFPQLVTVRWRSSRNDCKSASPRSVPSSVTSASAKHPVKCLFTATAHAQDAASSSRYSMHRLSAAETVSLNSFRRTCRRRVCIPGTVPASRKAVRFSSRPHTPSFDHRTTQLLTNSRRGMRHLANWGRYT